MTSVGGDKRPLEDILERLNDLSRAERVDSTIDLREPPPVPAQPAEIRLDAPPATVVREAAPAIAEAPSPPPVPMADAPVPVDPVPALVESETIDLTAPTTEVSLADDDSGTRVSTVLDRGPVRSVAPTYEGDGRYGRNAPVAAAAERAFSISPETPALPVSVKPDEEELAVEEAGPNWFRVAIAVLLGIAIGAAIGLIVLVV